MVSKIETKFMRMKKSIVFAFQEEMSYV